LQVDDLLQSWDVEGVDRIHPENARKSG